MPQYRHANEALTERFNRLARELDADRGDRPAMTDERDYFQLVDLAANDPETDPHILDEAGKRFADHFVSPYLHANDPAILITEIAALFEIHHRGRVRVESMDATASGLEIKVAFHCMDQDGAPSPPTRFDLAVMRQALNLRDPEATIEPLPEEGEATSRFRIRLKK